MLTLFLVKNVSRMEFWRCGGWSNLSQIGFVFYEWSLRAFINDFTQNWLHSHPFVMLKWPFTFILYNAIPQVLTYPYPNLRYVISDLPLVKWFTFTITLFPGEGLKNLCDLIYWVWLYYSMGIQILTIQKPDNLVRFFEF